MVFCYVVCICIPVSASWSVMVSGLGSMVPLMCGDNVLLFISLVWLSVFISCSSLLVVANTLYDVHAGVFAVDDRVDEVLRAEAGFRWE